MSIDIIRQMVETNYPNARFWALLHNGQELAWVKIRLRPGETFTHFMRHEPRYGTPAGHTTRFTHTGPTITQERIVCSPGDWDDGDGLAYSISEASVYALREVPTDEHGPCRPHWRTPVEPEWFDENNVPELETTAV